MVGNTFYEDHVYCIVPDEVNHGVLRNHNALDEINEKLQGRKSARTQGPFRPALIVLPVLIDWCPIKCIQILLSP